MIEDKDGCPQFHFSDTEDTVMADPKKTDYVYQRANVITILTANKLLREWFEKQTVIASGTIMDDGRTYRTWHEDEKVDVTQGASHTARLIGIRPIVKDSAESVLRDFLKVMDDNVVSYSGYDNETKALTDRARRVLGDEK